MALLIDCLCVRTLPWPICVFGNKKFSSVLSCLVALVVVEMHCTSNNGNSEVGLNPNNFSQPEDKTAIPFSHQNTHFYVSCNIMDQWKKLNIHIKQVMLNGKDLHLCTTGVGWITSLFGFINGQCRHVASRIFLEGQEKILGSKYFLFTLEIILFVSAIILYCKVFWRAFTQLLDLSRHI